MSSDRTARVEDVSMALVCFENGAMATVVNPVVSPREGSTVRFRGDLNDSSPFASRTGGDRQALALAGAGTR